LGNDNNIDLKIIQQQIEDYDENIWEEQKQKSKLYIEHFREKIKVRIESPNVYILHCPVGDLHIGHDGVDYEKAEYDAIKIGSCKYARAYNIGDSIDNFIKTSILEAIINATTTPKQQIKLLQQYIEFFNGNLLLMIGGNHDRWTKKVSGLDWLSPFTDKNNLLYAPDEFNIFWCYDSGVEYYFKMRHKYKYKSVYNVTHELKQMLRFSTKLFDVGITGHTHDVALEQVPMFGELKTFIKTGSYKITDPFNLECGYNEADPVFPCFVTSPFEKKITVFYNLDDGIFFVNEKNKGVENESIVSANEGEMCK
jgi:hypothetical protein